MGGAVVEAGVLETRAVGADARLSCLLCALAESTSDLGSREPESGPSEASREAAPLAAGDAARAAQLQREREPHVWRRNLDDRP